MLDFYLLADDQHMPGYPEDGGGKVIGSMDDQLFERLQVKKFIPDRFDYYSDFRWDTALIRHISEHIQKHVTNDSDVQQLMQLLDIAKANGSGLVAYAD